MEKYIENCLKDKIELMGGKCIKIMPLFNKGFPDRMVLLPGGGISFVELKNGNKGRTSKPQRIWISILKRLGFDAVVLKSKEEIDEYCRNLKRR